MSKNFLIFLMIGVITMMNFFGCSQKLKYENFSRQDAELNLSLDYPAGWLAKEHRGSNYLQVIFAEPKRQDKIFKAAIIVTIKEEPPAMTLEAVAGDLLQKRRQFKESKLLGKSKKRLPNLNTEVVELLLSYRTLERLYQYKKDAKIIPLKERIALFKEGAKIYTVTYLNTREEFNRFNPAFTHSLKTLKIGR